MNPATWSCEKGKLLASIMGDLAITCKDITDSYEEETNFNEKKPVKHKVFIFYLHFSELLLHNWYFLEFPVIW